MTRILYVDSASGRNFDDDGELKHPLRNVRTEISWIPASCTNLLHPCASFVVQKVTNMSRQLEDDYLVEAVEKNDFESSGKIENPG